MSSSKVKVFTDTNGILAILVACVQFIFGETSLALVCPCLFLEENLWQCVMWLVYGPDAADVANKQC